MANEAVILELNSFSNPQTFTCADGTAISKGTLLKISGDLTVSASAAQDVYGGVAAADKVASDGATKIAVYTPNSNNYFDMYTESTIALGTLVVLSGANIIKQAADADFEAGKVIGQACEASASGTPEVIRIRS